MSSEVALLSRIVRPYEDERRRTECLQVIFSWTGAKLDHGEYERADINATDNKKNTCLHYAAASGMRSSVEVRVLKLSVKNCVFLTDFAHNKRNSEGNFDWSSKK